MLEVAKLFQYCEEVKDAMYTVQCTLNTVQCTVYTVHCTVHNVQFAMYKIPSFDIVYIDIPEM